MGRLGVTSTARASFALYTRREEIDALAAVVGLEEATQLCRETADVIAELERMQRAGQVDMDLRLDGWLWTASSIAHWRSSARKQVRRAPWYTATPPAD